jgi:hypothetical protein
LAQRPPAVPWRGSTEQPTRIELVAVQRSAIAAIRQCVGAHGAMPAFDVVFDTVGRAFWTDFDHGTRTREHCLATAIRASMRVQPFNGTAMVRVRFPLAGTRW